MVKLTCACLNVKILAKKTDFNKFDTSTLELPSLGECPDDFFNHEISEVQLDLEGVKVEHSDLVCKRSASGWIINKCINCQMLTHANSMGTNRILVNLSLKSEPSIIEMLEKSPDYSPLYKVVLHSKNDNQHIRPLGVESDRYESLELTISRIRKQLNQFLLDEEAAMEERIRKYTENQRATYAELQSKAKRERNAMISLVLATEEESRKKMPTPAVEQRVELMSSNEMSGDMPPPPQLEKKVSSPYAKSSNGQSSKRKMAAPTYHRAYENELDPDDEDDALFSMEGDHGESVPFYESEDEEAEDTDDSTDGPYHHHSACKKPSSLYSSSVPISVPTFHRQISNRLDDLEDEDIESPNFENIAASMKALAQSVHGDGTEMFGDLPRRRYAAADSNM